MRRSTRAFTLIELLLVMVILAVLAGIAVPTYIGYAREAKIKATKAGLSNISTALHEFEVKFDRFPTNDEGLAALVTAPAALPAWDHAFLAKMPVDAWGHAFLYRAPGIAHPESFDIGSLGPDEQPDTGDEITQDDI